MKKVAFDLKIEMEEDNDLNNVDSIWESLAEYLGVQGVEIISIDPSTNPIELEVE